MQTLAEWMGSIDGEDLEGMEEQFEFCWQQLELPKLELTTSFKAFCILCEINFIKSELLFCTSESLVHLQVQSTLSRSMVLEAPERKLN